MSKTTLTIKCWNQL